MSRGLIAAQEQERSRIARELHDDINQRIAMLFVDLSQFQQNIPGSDKKFVAGSTNYSGAYPKLVSRFREFPIACTLRHWSTWA